MIIFGEKGRGLEEVWGSIYEGEEKEMVENGLVDAYHCYQTEEECSRIGTDPNAWDLSWNRVQAKCST